MGSISRNQFMQMQQEKAERAAAPRTITNRVGYFSLRDDGDEAIVRFIYHTPDELEIFTTHAINVDGKFRRVNCLRSYGDPVDKCPLCASGQNFQNRTYIKLIEYVRNDDGSITPTPRIWERPASYVQILSNLFTEYGDISNCVFKVKRSGERGSMQTTYNIMFGNPSLYNEQLYPKDFSAFNDYKILGGPLMDKSYDEMRELLGDAAEVETVQVGTPVAQPATTASQQTWTAPEAAPTGGQKRITY